MARDYYVEVPIAGKIGLLVSAESKEEAESLAFDGCACFMLSVEDTLPSNVYEGDVEWDAFPRLTSGNVNHFHVNEISVEEE